MNLKMLSAKYLLVSASMGYLENTDEKVSRTSRDQMMASE